MSEIIVKHGDFRKILDKHDIEFSFSFSDPPFGIGQNYIEYEDKRECIPVLVHDIVSYCGRYTKPGGVMALHGPDDLAIAYLTETEPSKLYYQRLAWINWHYRFGECGDTNWIDSRCHCLIYRIGPGPHTWNPDSVLVESDRSSKYSDKRIEKSSRAGKRVPLTVWGVPSDGRYWGRVQGNSTERCKHMPNQLPEVYLERLIRAYTNPGDWVFDGFGGSGTTAVVCQALNRNCLTCDVSKKTCKAIEKRLERGAVRVKKEPADVQ